MTPIKLPLFARIVGWSFLNLLVLGAILLIFFNYNFRFRPDSAFSGVFGSSIEVVTRQITNEADEKTRFERDEILKNYSEKYPGVEFYLFDFRGNQLGGREIRLPPAVVEEIISERMPPRRPDNDGDEPPPREPRFEGEPRPPRGVAPMPSTYVRTSDPTVYWFGSRILLYDKDAARNVRARLIAASDSFYGYGLFFNPMPWLVLTGIIVSVSMLFWFPFVRNLTGNLTEMTRAAEQIADENFLVRVDEKRTDELGRLGKSINHLATRLDGFVGGQKRFLGDISHELNSPLARMQFALSILENRVDEKNLDYVADVKEEVELMSKLVSELLAYSKAGIKTVANNLEKIRLLPLVEAVIEREKAKQNAAITVEIAADLEACAHPELLSRAVGNVLRNAVRYAGAAGAITVSAARENETVVIEIADRGAGVPEAELEKLFDPFYRLETHRSRETGGTGLGLAIVKTCVEACQGKVAARNRKPHGLAVVIALKS